MKRDTNYSLHGHILEVESWSKYLGVNISDDLTWRDHIEKTASKANRKQSSAKSFTDECFTTSWRSLMKTKKSRGPRTMPCGTLICSKYQVYLAYVSEVIMTTASCSSTLRAQMMP
jgi:hypothetical protein